MQLKIQAKQAGKRRNQVVKSKIELAGIPKTVQELLELSVRACVQDFRNRQQAGAVLLGKQAIEDQASAGKVGFGLFYGETDVDEERAVATATQAFEDGIVVVFLDNAKKENLAETIQVDENTVVTFVKLTMLAGRMW